MSSHYINCHRCCFYPCWKTCHTSPICFLLYILTCIDSVPLILSSHRKQHRNGLRLKLDLCMFVSLSHSLPPPSPPWSLPSLLPLSSILLFAAKPAPAMWSLLHENSHVLWEASEKACNFSPSTKEGMQYKWNDFTQCAFINLSKGSDRYRSRVHY